MATSQKVDNPLEQLLTCGQSYWLDNLTQHMIASGELKGWIRDHGLRGITANPTTFREALSSSDYDRHIESLTHEGRSTKDIYETLLIHDVQQACDILHDVYRETDGLDGYVSLEVSPHLAHRSPMPRWPRRGEYVERVNRPNLSSKFRRPRPGYRRSNSCFARVSESISLCCSSIPSYQAVIEAYMFGSRTTRHVPSTAAGGCVGGEFFREPNRRAGRSVVAATHASR